MRTSYSNLDCYKTCPLKYKYQNIDKIKAPKSINAVFGSAIHASLKFMFEKNPLYPALDQVLDYFREIWKKKKDSADESTKPEEKIDESVEEMFYKDGIATLQKFYKSNPPWNFNVIDMESRFELDVAEEKTGDKHTLSGIIDRIDKIDDGVFEIIDYKTGRKLPPQKDVDNNLQLSAYLLGLISKWPHLDPEKIKLSLYFLKHGEKISTKRTKEQLEETKRDILSAVKEINDRINDNNNFPPAPSPLCDWCEYRKMCPMWRHMYRKQEKEKIKNQEELNHVIGEYFRLKEQNSQNNDRLDDLKTFIFGFMDEQKVERVFGDEGYLTRTVKEKNDYDLEKLKEVLEKAGRWKDILEPDDKKLNKLLPSFPSELQEKILSVTEKKKEIRLNMKKRVTLENEEENAEK